MTKVMLLLSVILTFSITEAQARHLHHSVQQVCIPTKDIMFPCAYRDPNFLSGIRSIKITMKRDRSAYNVNRSIEPVRRHRTPRTIEVRNTPVIKTPVIINQIASIGTGTIKAASGAIAHVAASASGHFQCLISALEGQGYPIKFMGGYARGGHIRGSLHYSGLALDVNQIARGVTIPRMPANEIQLANSCGLISGAQWAYNDSGHFQLGGYAGSGRTHYASRHYKHYVYHHRSRYANASR